MKDAAVPRSRGGLYPRGRRVRLRGTLGLGKPALCANIDEVDVMKISVPGDDVKFNDVGIATLAGRRQGAS